MLYESVLLFGVLFSAALIFAVAFNQRSAINLRQELDVWLFFVLGIYFIWFWIHGGQTLPMKTWHIRLVTKDGMTVSPQRALARYILCWLWCTPGLALAWLLQEQRWMATLFPALNFVLWAMTPLFDKDRQFLHDRLAGTRLIAIS
jgi:uncharacterized RDD family membrane protein YckC